MRPSKKMIRDKIPYLGQEADPLHSKPNLEYECWYIKNKKVA